MYARSWRMPRAEIRESRVEIREVKVERTESRVVETTKGNRAGKAGRSMKEKNGEKRRVQGKRGRGKGGKMWCERCGRWEVRPKARMEKGGGGRARKTDHYAAIVVMLLIPIPFLCAAGGGDVAPPAAADIYVLGCESGVVAPDLSPCTAATSSSCASEPRPAAIPSRSDLIRAWASTQR